MSLLHWVAGWAASPKPKAGLQECAPEASARDRHPHPRAPPQRGEGPAPGQLAARTALGQLRRTSETPPGTGLIGPPQPWPLLGTPACSPGSFCTKPLSFSAQPFKGERRRLLPREQRDWGGPGAGRQHRPQPRTGPRAAHRPGCGARGGQRDPAGSREVDLHDLRLQLRQPRRALQSSAGQTHNYNNPPPSPGVTGALLQSVLRTVIYSYNMCLLRVDFGVGGQESQKPATQICHRLRNKAQLSERGTHPGDPRVHQRAAGARAPFSTSTPAPRRPGGAPSSRSSPAPPEPSTETRPGWAAVAPGSPRPLRAALSRLSSLRLPSGSPTVPAPRN
ncbi:uncharacterized protein LOC122117883 [Dipodomys spectabilis]|uniref:uncharacterized protein LOC122117883 n=1 Tax=Dipodomys spectabilis TaxID=105255 RepID=UPI001C53E7F1|nr:uncharacterized protein LOC122117883 [Dipodomys spectabilis]